MCEVRAREIGTIVWMRQPLLPPPVLVVLPGREQRTRRLDDRDRRRALGVLATAQPPVDAVARGNAELDIPLSAEMRDRSVALDRRRMAEAGVVIEVVDVPQELDRDPPRGDAQEELP